MEKSSIFFSKNAAPQLQEMICSELDGIAVQTKSKYLGLPLVIGRSKMQVFKYIEDAAVKRISSWKNNFLSSAGKEILLKSVIMALPIYSMSCYKLSNAVCTQIEKRMANSWWGEKDNNRKIHWAKWEKLTATKADGGLDFKDLKAMNVALLAKQLWRILQEPQLLMSRVMKARYFPNQHLFQIQKKGQDSWLWKSWLGAKHLVEKGVRWRVGDGRSISIWDDNWIPTVGSWQVRSRKPVSCPFTKVSELIDHHRLCWKHQLLDQLFSPQEVKQILSIPVSHYGVTDHMYWNIEKKGCFSVKSAYKLAQSLGQTPSKEAETSRTGDDNNRMWRRVWKLPIQPKLRHFLWRCLHNWLATGAAIRRRGMEVDDVCKRCGLAKETREHMFFQCPDSLLVWKLAPLNWEGIQHLTDSFETWWQSICLAKSDSMFQKRLELTVYILWYIWKARCLWHFQAQKWDATEIVQRARQEWEAVESIMKPVSNQQSCCAMAQPEVAEGLDHTIRINVAAERQQQAGKVGLGWHFRGADGGIILAEAEVQHADHTHDVAELKAIQRTLVEARRRNMRSIEVRLDVKPMVAWLQRKIPPISAASAIVDHILMLTTFFSYCRFVFIQEDWNLDCHVLARNALSNDSSSLGRFAPSLGTELV